MGNQMPNLHCHPTAGAACTQRSLYQPCLSMQAEAVCLCEQGLQGELTWSPASYEMLEPLTSSSTCTQERSEWGVCSSRITDTVDRKGESLQRPTSTPDQPMHHEQPHNSDLCLTLGPQQAKKLLLDCR